MIKNIFIFSLLLVLSSCASKTIYYWGHYQDLLYDEFLVPGKAPPEIQVDKLQQDIQKAKSENKPLPPGFYAHLGYQYLLMGRAQEAKQSFEAERAQFPESVVLMDRYLKKFKTKGTQK